MNNNHFFLIITVIFFLFGGTAIAQKKSIVKTMLIISVEIIDMDIITKYSDATGMLWQSHNSKNYN